MQIYTWSEQVYIYTGCIFAHVQINFYIYAIAFTCQKIHPDANYTYIYNIHPVCKSAHVNGALECPALIEDRRNYLGQNYCSHYNILKFKQVYDYTCDNNSVHKMRYFCNSIKVINANVCPPWQLNFYILLYTYIFIAITLYCHCEHL